MVGQGSVSVFKVEALLLLTAFLLPVDIHCGGIGGEESGHALYAKTHVEHIVLAEQIAQHDVLAGGSFGGEHDGRVGERRYVEIQVLGRDIGLLGHQGII